MHTQEYNNCTCYTSRCTQTSSYVCLSCDVIVSLLCCFFDFSPCHSYHVIHVHAVKSFHPSLQTHDDVDLRVHAGNHIIMIVHQCRSTYRCEDNETYSHTKQPTNNNTNQEKNEGWDKDKKELTTTQHISWNGHYTLLLLLDYLRLLDDFRYSTFLFFESNRASASN